MKLTTLIKVMALVFLYGTIHLQADNTDSDKDSHLSINTSYASYVRMSTEELQEALEILSINGKHNLGMGLELMKRWTAES